MLSRLLARQGNAAVFARSTVPSQLVAIQGFHTNPKDTEKTKQLITLWDEKNKRFFGPDRDKKNFPHPSMPQTHEAVRLGFIPRSWFDAFYCKTGVSGPYLFVGGLGMYLMSKEIMVMDHTFFDFLGFWAAFIFISKKWGPSISKYLQQQAEALDNKNWTVPMDKTRTAFANHIQDVDQSVAEEGKYKHLYAVQQENVDLQLEARYRERVAAVHSAVKKRLDYQVELINTKKRLEQQHMVDWIVNNVVKGITPQQEKEALGSCIANLKSLASQQQATAV